LQNKSNLAVKSGIPVDEFVPDNIDNAYVSNTVDEICIPACMKRNEVILFARHDTRERKEGARIGNDVAYVEFNDKVKRKNLFTLRN
jgi:hypothetical protein